MATSSYYGRMRATDADREKVLQVLQDAYADGRLDREEFDVRSSQLFASKTYDQLASLTTDLRRPVAYQVQPYQPTYHQIVPAGRTNPLAAVSLGFGIGQIFLPFLGALIAIICGHVARSQIKASNESGDGLAIAGLVLGYLGFALWTLLIIGASR
jgi:hypothetical protein